MSLRSLLRTPIRRAVRPLTSKFAKKRVDLPMGLWKLERDEKGTLSLDEHSIRNLITRFGSPLHVVDASKVRRNAQDFLDVPAGSDAGVECYYSYKTNPVPGVLSRLHAMGVGAEVISEYEFWLARRLGVPGDRIVLNGPARSLAAMRDALDMGALWQLNSREEIPLLCQVAHSVGKKARVGLRVVPTGSWGGQFGEPIVGGRALDVFGELLRQPEFEVVAVHAHMGGELSTAERVRGLVLETLGMLEAVRERYGHTLEIMDLGGSLACPTVRGHGATAQRLNRTFAMELVARDPSEVLSIRDYVSTIVQTTESECRRRNLPRPRIFVEPGRSLTGNTQFLVCSVIGLKESGAPEGHIHAILDAGVNVAEPVRTEYHQIFTVEAPRPVERPYRLVGPICTPMDTLAWSWRLPELAPGDALAIMDSGAYFIPFATSFSFPQPAIVLLDQGEVSLLRRAETFEDLVDRDQPA